MKSNRYIIFLLSMLAVSSCAFDNEMAYPRIFAEITSFQVENESVPTVIDKRNMKVNVVLNELADLKQVKVKKYTCSDGSVSSELPEVLDLTRPISVELSNYHVYKWTIEGIQPVERYIECPGSAEIKWMPEACQAQVFMLRTSNLKKIQIEDMKLGLEGSEVVATIGMDADGQIKETPCEFPMTLDCSYSRKFLVEYKGERTEWTVVFEHMQMEPTIKRVFPRCWHAGVEAEFDGIGDVTMQYQKKGTDKWKNVGIVNVKGTKVTADIPHLKQDTDYEVRLVQGENIGDAFAFKTGKPDQLPNMGFEDWTKDGKVWYPYSESEHVWASANPGVAAVSNNTTTPENNIKVEGSSSTKMITGNAFGILAAGNLFTGQFGHLEGTTAHLYWGTPFTSRPSRLTGWYKYIPSTISGAEETLSGAGNMKNPYFKMNGKTDCMQIMVALVAEGTEEIKDNEGNVVNTAFKVVSSKPGTPELNPKKPGHDPRVIAFAEIISDEAVTGDFVKFDLPIQYYDERTPAYVIVVACSSAYGNFFTGGEGSLLYVDDFKFVYE